MPKHKHSHPVPGEKLLKLHLILYVICMVLLGLSIYATLNYSGNRRVDLTVFVPFFMERFAVVILWGTLVLSHVGFQQVRAFLHNRAQHQYDYTVYRDVDKRFHDDYVVETENTRDDVAEMKSALR